MKSLQPCPTLCNPMNHSRRVSSVYRILQARRLRWVAMLPSRGSSWHRDQSRVSYICLHWQAGSLLLAPPEKPSVSLVQSLSHVWLSATPWIAARQASRYMPVRMVRIQITDNIKSSWGSRAVGAIHCWWENSIEQPLWKTIWQFLKN